MFGVSGSVVVLVTLLLIRVMAPTRKIALIGS